MAKMIDIIVNLIDTQAKKQLSDLENKKYKVNVDIDKNGINEADKSVKQLGSSVASTNTTFGKLKNTISNTFSSGKIAMTSYLAVLHEISKAAKEAKTTILEMDDAVTDLSVAMNGTREEASEYVKVLNKQAINLKTTTKSVTDASDAWLRQGKSIKETETLIRDSLVLSKVGKIESADSTNYLTSALNGYKLEAEDAISVIDKLTAVDAESASEAGGLALSMSKTASAADMAGVSMDKLIAYLATVKEVTQDSDEAVGNMAKTMFSRMNQVKAGKFIDAETGESLNDMEKVLKEVGISMRDMNGQFISSEIILDELGKKFNEFDSVTQRAIATALGGTYQYEKVIALLSNYGDVLKYAETSASSAGSAMQKFNESYLGSLEASQARLQASFESMIMNSDMDEVYSGIIDSTTALVDFINQTNALKGVMSGLTVSGGIKGFLAIKTAINESYISLNQFSNALKLVKQTNISTADFDKLLLLTKNLSDSQMKMVLSSNALEIEQKKLLLVNAGLAEEEALLKLQTYGLTTAQTGLTVATTSLGNAFKGLLAYMAANPILVFTMAISGLTMAYQSYNQKLEETRQKNIEASESAIDHANNLEELYSKYIKLSSIQERTSSEENEFKSVIEDVTKALGNKAEMLEGLTVGTDEYTEALKNATKAELESQYATAKIGAKAAEEELKEKAYNSWSGSQITIQLNTQMTGVEEHMSALEEVRGILAEFEDEGQNGIEWEPIGWDENKSDMNAVVDYYNALIEARNKLVTSENADFLMNSDIYEDINTTINSLSESVEKYIEQQYNALKLNYEWQNGIPQTKEEFQTMQDSLLSTVGASVYLQDSFKSLLMADFSSLASDIEEVSEAQEKIAETQPISLLGISETVDELNTKLKPTLDSLAKAYQDIFTQDGFTRENIGIDMIASIKEEFDKLNEMEGIDIPVSSFEEFADVLSDTSSEASDIQNQFDSLASEIVNTTDFTKVSTEAFDVLIKSLKNMGITNARETLSGIRDAQNEIISHGYDLANITEEEAKAFIEEGTASAYATEYLKYYMLQKSLANNPLETSGDVERLEALCNSLGITGELLEQVTRLKNAFNAVEAGAPLSAMQGVIDDAKAKIAELSNGEGSYTFNFDGNVTGASKAGKASADAYLEAFEKELKNLQGLRDNGEISEKEYLDRLRDLYIRYFKDRKKYLNEFRKYEQEYLSGMKSLYDSALSGITSILSDKIDDLNDARDEEIEKLEEAKEKAVSAIQEQIDAKEAEIDAIQRASEQRKNEMRLQQAQYNLEKMMNQRTTLVYSDAKGYFYENSAEGIRNAKEELTQAEEEIEIARIETEIDSLETKLKGVEEYYDSLIEKKNDYYDQQIKFLEDQREMWEDFTNMIEMAEVLEPLKALGISMEDILSGNTAVLDAFKNDYFAICAAMNSGNQDYLSALSETSGKSTEELLAMAQQFKDTGTSISELGNVASTASTPIKDTASAIGEMSTNSEGVSEDINSINTALDTLSGENKLQGITDAFQTLLNKIDEVATALGITTEQMESGTGLIGAIQALNEAQISTELLNQFTELESAINAVTTAINGGTEDGVNLTDKGSPSSTGESKTSGADSGGSGLTQALEEQVNKAKELLPEEIALFSGDEESLLSAVTKVTTAIAGGGDSEGGEKKESSGEGEVDTSHLMGALEAQYNLAEEKIPVETTYFTELATAIEACVIQLKAMVETLENMPSATISFGGGVSGGAGVNGTAHYEGTANVRGNWRVRESGRSLVGELGQEIVVRDGKFFTVGDNGAEFVDLQRGDIVFNHVQTKSLLKNGYVTGRGKSYANGTFSAAKDDVVIQTPTNLPPYLRELREGDKMYDLIQKMNAHNELIQSQIIPPVNSIQKNFETMTRNISNVNTNNVANTQTINMTVNCPGITSKEVAEQVKTELNSAFMGLHLNAYQQAHKR